MKRTGLAVAGAAGLCAALGWLYMNGSMTRLGDRARDAALELAARAGFRVEEITVIGRENMPPEELERRIGLRRGQPVFAVDIAALRADIAADPWVKTVRVSRRLPGHIVVEIGERRPVALWQYNKQVSVIDAEGAVLARGNLSRFSGLPLVVGAGAQTQAARLLSLLRAEPEVAGRVSSAVRVGERRWDLYLENGVVVKLPGEDAGFALARLAKTQREKRILDKDVSVVDLRLQDRIVVEARGDNKENI